jgi:hypothetical protein
MRVKARVIAGHISISGFHVKFGAHTAYLHLAPKLCFALLGLLFLASIWAAPSWSCANITLYSDLAGMNETIRLETRAPCVILGRVGYAWRR